MAFDQSIADKVCAGLSEGRSLLSISRDHGMPAESTLRLWEFDNKAHAANSAHARSIGLPRLAEECLEIANTIAMGQVRTVKADGTEEVRHEDMLGHRRLQIDTRMRLLGKWLPKIYGDKIEHDHKGKVTISADPLDEQL